MAETLDTARHTASWQKGSTWLRGLFMLLLVIGMGIGQTILNLVALVQFLWLLFAGEHNRALAGFGASLATWLAEAARFQCGATEEMPFPWKAWPSEPAL